MEYLTVREIARMLGVRELTVCAWLRNGRLRGVKPGGKCWRVSRADLEKFLRQGKQNS